MVPARTLLMAVLIGCLMMSADRAAAHQAELFTGATKDTKVLDRTRVRTTVIVTNMSTHASSQMCGPGVQRAAGYLCHRDGVAPRAPVPEGRRLSLGGGTGHAQVRSRPDQAGKRHRPSLPPRLSLVPGRIREAPGILGGPLHRIT